MKSKAHLVLMEQAVMLLVFALAAALCLRAFVWADTQSQNGALRDQALVQAQSAAEVVKSCGGDLEAAAEHWGGSCTPSAWTVRFDGDWRQTDGEGSFRLRVTPKESGLRYLGSARVEVFQNETQLAALNVAWQEVEQGGG